MVSRSGSLNRSPALKVLSNTARVSRLRILRRTSVCPPRAVGFDTSTSRQSDMGAVSYSSLLPPQFQSPRSCTGHVQHSSQWLSNRTSFHCRRLLAGGAVCKFAGERPSTRGPTCCVGIAIGAVTVLPSCSRTSATGITSSASGAGLAKKSRTRFLPRSGRPPRSAASGAGASRSDRPSSIRTWSSRSLPGGQRPRKVQTAKCLGEPRVTVT